MVTEIKQYNHVHINNTQLKRWGECDFGDTLHKVVFVDMN